MDGVSGELDNWQFGWLQSKDAITSVVVEGYVKAPLLDSMFRDCSFLETVDFSGLDFSTVLSMDSMFYGCSSLTNLDASEWDVSNVSTMPYMFAGCSSLESLDVSGWDTSAVQSAYGLLNGCTSLSNVTVGNGITQTVLAQLPSLEINGHSDWWSNNESRWYTVSDIAESRAGVADTYRKTEFPPTPVEDFTYTVDWDEVTITGYLGEDADIVIPSKIDGYSVGEIGFGAFEHNATITSVTIPDSVTTVQSQAFHDCPALRAFYVSEANPSLSDADGVLMNKDQSVLMVYPNAKGSSYSIPDSVDTIDDYAFSGCASLESVTIPNSVKEVGLSAFSECTSLASVTIPDSVTYIYGWAFDSCSALKSVIIEGSAATISLYAFSYCTSLESVVLPDSITTIEQDAFYGCSSLVSIELPASLTSIGNHAFSGCMSLESVVIPGSVREIGESAFASCFALESVEIPASVTSVGAGAFCNLAEGSVIYVPTEELASLLEGKFSEDLTTVVVATHVHDFLVIDRLEPTCTAYGRIEYRCDGCGESYSELIPPTGHTWDEGVVTVEPTVDAEGVKTYTCMVCGEKMVEPIPKIIIELIDISDAEVELIPSSAYYTGDYITFRTRVILDGVELTPDVDYGLDPDNPFKEVGTYDYAIIGKEAAGYTGTIFPVTFTILPAPERDFTYEVVGGEAIITGYTGTADDIDIPEYIDDYPVTGIASLAFDGCDTLTFIGIPACITSIADDAFRGCSALETLYVYPGNPAYSSYNGVLLNKEETVLIQYPVAKPSSSYDMLPTVETICPNAFSGCTNLVHVRFDDSMTMISPYAFSGCESLASVEVPESLAVIGEGAFAGCISLETFEIPNTVTSIGASAFQRCSALSSIVLPDSITSIGSLAFYDLAAGSVIYVPNEEIADLLEGAYNEERTTIELQADFENFQYSVSDGEATITGYSGNRTVLTIPAMLDGYPVTAIGRNAFSVNESLISVTIPDSVTSIEYGAFENCTSLASVEIPDSVVSIGERAFAFCAALESVFIPASVESIGKCAFGGCRALEAFAVDEQSTSFVAVDGVLFDHGRYRIIQYPNGKKASSYTVPSTVTIIEAYAFFDCDNLVAVSLPGSVHTLGERSFCDCDALTSFTIPESVTKIGFRAFSECTSLESFTVAEGNSVFAAVDGALINSSEATLICYPIASPNASFAIPDSVTTVADYAFDGCTSLASVTIPSSVTTLGTYAFNGCSSLGSVSIPDSVIAVGSSAFARCSSLASVNISNSLTEIPDYMFLQCTSLAEVTIPENVSSIGWSAFNGCTSLATVTILGDLGYVGNDAFMKLANPSVIWVQRESAWNWIVDRVDPDRTTVQMLPHTDPFEYEVIDGTITITGYTGTETDLVIPAEIDGYPVTAIGSNAFAGHGELSFVTLPDSVASVGSGAFYGLADPSVIYVPSQAIAQLLTGKYDETVTTVEVTGVHVHAYESIGQKAPKCTEDGWVLYKCFGCGDTYYETLPATGHDWLDVSYAWADGDGSVTATRICKNDATHTESETAATTSAVTKAATCTETGEMLLTASFANASFATQTKVVATPALGHTEVVDPAVAATCTEPGMTEGKHCSVCGEVLVAQQAVPATGHTWDKGVVTVEPTIDAEGIMTCTCTVCGVTKTEAIPKIQPADLPVKTDGTPYHIVSGLSDDFVLDVAKAMPEAGSNISIWTNNGGANQLFTFEFSSDGCIVLRNVANPALVLDAAGANPSAGANVSTWTYNGGANQKWHMITAVDGYYLLVSEANSSLVLEAAGSAPEVGANVDLWTGNAGANQRWKFVPANDLADAQVAATGMARNLIDGKAAAPEVALTLYGTELTEGVDYELFYDDGTAESTTVPTEPGLYVVTARAIGGGKYVGSVKVGIFDLSEAPEDIMLETQAYRIVSASDADFILDVAKAMPEAGSNISIWTSNGGANQLFTIEESEDGFFVLRNVANDKLVLDAAGAVPEIGANVSTWTYNEGMNQKWTFIPSDDGQTFAIASASNPEFVLDAAGSSPEIGANVGLWTGNGGLNQQWTLVPANDLSYAEVAVFGMERNYTGTPLSAGISVTLNNEELVAGRDYTVNYTGAPVEVGSYGVSIVGNGGYSGTVELGTLTIHPAPDIEEGARYHLASGFSDAFVLDVAGAQPVSGANVSIWSDNGGLNQMFTVELQDSGYYVLRNVANPSLVLDAAGEEPQAGANISTWAYHAALNQQWVFVPSADRPGYFMIQSAANPDVVLDAAGSAPKAGANVGVWTANGGDNQLWKPVVTE